MDIENNNLQRNMITLIVCQFIVVASITMINPFLAQYLHTLGIENQNELQTWSGIISSATFMITFIVAPIWGRLADRYGRKIMLIRSSAGMAVVMFFMGFATSPMEVLILRLIDGLWSGFIPVSVSLIAASTDKNMLHALGMLQIGTVAGVSVGPIIGGIIAEFLSYQTIFFITAASLICVTLIVMLLIIEKKPEYTTTESILKQNKRLLKNKPIRYLLAITIIVQIAMFGPGSLLSIFVYDIHEQNAKFWTGTMLSCTAVAATIFSPLLGRISKKWGTIKIFKFALIGVGISLIAHYFTINIITLLIVRCLLGISMSGLQPSLNTLISQTTPKKELGTVHGLQTSSISLGQALGPLICGPLSSEIGGIAGIRTVFFINGVVIFLALRFLFFKLFIFYQKKIVNTIHAKKIRP